MSQDFERGGRRRTEMPLAAHPPPGGFAAFGVNADMLVRRGQRERTVEKMQFGDLTAELDYASEGVLRIHLSGRSSSREAGKTLAPLFDRVLAEAKAQSRSLALHFERLEYFNSSTIAALVQFIRAVHEAVVPLTVAYDGKQRWQAMSFDALRRALRPFETGASPSVRFSET
jgi:hypothetical protein